MILTFAPENASALKFTVSRLLGYEMQNSKVKLTWACAEDHVIFNLVMQWSLERGQQLRNCVPVGIHLNLIRVRDQESTKHNTHFAEWNSRYITIIMIILPQLTSSQTQENLFKNLTECVIKWLRKAKVLLWLMGPT